jgi:putative Mn2+ efflux pump MntP
MEKFKKISSVILIIFGLLMIAGMILNRDNGTSKNSLAADLVMVVIVGLVPLLTGIFMIRSANQNKKRTTINQTEVAVLRQAQAQEGRITIAEAALSLQTSIAEAKEVLDKMQSNSIFEIALTEDGTLIYQINQSLNRIKPEKGTNLV